MVDMSNILNKHPPNPLDPASSLQKFEMGGEEGGVALRRKYVHGGPYRVLRERDGMVTSQREREGSPAGW